MMTPEEELQNFRAQQPLLVKRARRVALVFGILACTVLISYVYVFFQQTAAKKREVMYEVRLKQAEDALSAERKGLIECQQRIVAKEEEVRISQEAAKLARTDCEEWRLRASRKR
jgi:hypothetical protein